MLLLFELDEEEELAPIPPPPPASDEMFTNLMEYNARDSDGDGIIDGRSTDPLNPDTDGDGLKDGIEVIGWYILV